MQRVWRILICVLPALIGASHFEREGISQGAPCVVSTRNGDVQGVVRPVSCAFLGIPFGAPPVDNRRWQPPEPAAGWWPAVLNATSAPIVCPQITLAGLPTGSEDCLKLNIWTPNPTPTSPAPVIVWFHTGEFGATSANFAAHNGANIAEQTGTIVVAANYRLGPFGFLAHSALTSQNPAYTSSGNYGLLDQRAALAWVQANITAFGGDPTRVTIAGTSAGAHSVGLHLVSPWSANLFARAIMQSGYASTRWKTLTEGESQGNDFALALGCTDPSQVLTCMRSKNRDQVLQALPIGRGEFVERPRVFWNPVVDRLEIPDQPRALYERGAFNSVPLIIGANRDEGWAYVDRSFPAGLTAAQYEAALTVEFGPDAAAILGMYPAADYPSPKDALARLAGDVEYVCEARRVARLVERTRTPVYLYSFEYEVDAVSPDRVIHGLESNLVFGNNYGPPSNYVLNAADLGLFRSLSGYWTRFAETGRPNSVDSEIVHWPEFKHPTGDGRGADQFLVFDSPIHEDKRLRENHCDFWDQFFFRSVVGGVPASAP